MKNNQEVVHVTVKATTFVKALSILLGVVFTLMLINKTASVLTLIAIAIFLAIALNPPVSWIARRLKSHSRVRATALAYILVMFILILFMSLIIPPLVSQTLSFLQNVPDVIRNFSQQDSSVNQLIQKYNLSGYLNNFAADFGNSFGKITQPALSTATTIGTTFVNLIAILILTFMMLVEGPAWISKFWALQPKNKQKDRREIAYKMYKVVTGYVNGQVLIAAIDGFFAFIALVILSNIFNVTVNAVALGALVSLFALLPMIGTTIGAVFVVIACLFVSTPLAVAIGIYFLIYQQIENATIQPYIQSRNNNLSPLAVFVAAMVGVSIAGFLGALLAIPVAGCIGVLIENEYKKRADNPKKDTVKKAYDKK